MYSLDIHGCNHFRLRLIRVWLKDSKPQALRSTKGSEFVNRWVKQFIKSENIYHYYTQNESKANYAERSIHTLKTMMYRYWLISKQLNMKMFYKILFQIVPISSWWDIRQYYLTQTNVQEGNEHWIHSNQSLSLKECIETQNLNLKGGSYLRLSHIKHPLKKDYQENRL